MIKTAHAVRQLICAAGSGDLAVVRTILRKTPDAACDWRPIMEASYKGFAPVVELLVERGADVNAISTRQQNRPLHRAAERGHQDVIAVLLRCGAEIDARGTWLQTTPLGKAALDGHVQVGDLLLKRAAAADRCSAAAIGCSAKVCSGIDKNCLTSLGYCAVCVLTLPQLVKIAQPLIAEGAAVNANRSSSGHS